MARILNVLKHFAFGVLVLAACLWTVTAFRFHITDELLAVVITATGIIFLCVLLLRVRSKCLAWAALALCVLGVASWYQTITPQDNRNWAADVSRGVMADIDGNLVTLKNLRDFNWQTTDKAEQRWISETYDLSKLSSVDVITSVWDSPNFAHLLVSFGFKDRENVVFSVEIRREAGENFNEIGGFFRQFELVLIAATERDIVRLRTDVREETVKLFPVTLTLEQRQQLFLSFADYAIELQSEPAFYNTLTDNCTTVVYKLASNLWPNMPLDWRVVLSGHVPSYLHSLGVLEGDVPLKDQLVNARLPNTSLLPVPGKVYSSATRSAIRDRS